MLKDGQPVAGDQNHPVGRNRVGPQHPEKGNVIIGQPPAAEIAPGPYQQEAKNPDRQADGQGAGPGGGGGRQGQAQQGHGRQKIAGVVDRNVAERPGNQHEQPQADQQAEPGGKPPARRVGQAAQDAGNDAGGGQGPELVGPAPAEN